MSRLASAALFAACALAGALLCALLFTACEDSGPYVRIPVPEVEYTR